jgi:periplasmic protein TonB
MFVESLVESTPLLRTRNRIPTLAAIGLQACFVAALLAIPMLHPELLPTNPLKLSTLAPPPTPAPPAPAPERLHITTVVSSAPSAPAAPSQAIADARHQLTSPAPGVDAPILAIATEPGSMNPAQPFSTTSPGTPNVVVRPAEPAGRLHISGGVTAGLLLAPIQPVYPQIARLTHTAGTVVIEAIISKSGNIQSAHAVSGPAMLQSAALDAVRAAHYRPYLLNDQPTEVETTITVNFRMNQ